MSNESLACLPKSRKCCECHVRECLMHLYANTNFCMWSFHLLLYSSCNVCNIEIIVQFMCSTFLLAWGWQSVVFILLAPHSFPNSWKRSFLNYPPWSYKMLSGKPNLSIKSMYNLSAAVLVFQLAIGYACVNPNK